jgi:hypothetical protein
VVESAPGGTGTVVEGRVSSLMTALVAVASAAFCSSSLRTVLLIFSQYITGTSIVGVRADSIPFSGVTGQHFVY